MDGNLHLAVPSMNSSIKPSLQHFHFCRVELSLGILIFSIFAKKYILTAAKNM
jgi:hypothetical protein